MYQIFFALLMLYSVFSPADLSVGDELKSIPVQAGGRVQPFDTFARDSLRFLSGKETWGKKPAIDVLISWMLIPDHWNKQRFIQIRDSVLRKALKLPLDQVLFTSSEILQNSHFVREVEELRTRVQRKENLNEYFKALQKLERQIILYHSFQRGDIPGLVPVSEEDKNWTALSELSKGDKAQTLFQNIIKNYVATVTDNSFDTANDPQNTQQNIVKLREAVSLFQNEMSKRSSDYAKAVSIVKVEVHYNAIKPFRYSWIFYLSGFLILFFYGLFHFRIFFYIPLFCFGLAFLTQGYGMLLRSLIMGRPPVTNMYETVVWVPWVCVILGAFFWIRQKMFSVFAVSCAVALFCLLLADSAPHLLDGRLTPLEAVLRSNFWLSTHVLIITMSYSAFFLAFALGDVLLYLFFRNRNKESDKRFKNIVRIYSKSIDRLLQIGVVLLATGTILGGIWADYSWGRFWAWDPKETWALITLLGYLALLHGRLVGWVKEFGMATGSVLLFFLVVMAWYGVNYVLGQGLHSYGFGSGGVEYVSGFAFLHLLYVLFVWFFRKKKS